MAAVMGIPESDWNLSPNERAARNRLKQLAAGFVRAPKGSPSYGFELQAAMEDHAGDLNQGVPGSQTAYSDLEKAGAARRVAQWQQNAPLGSGASTLALPGGWKNFMDFHNQQAALAQGRGNNYSLGSFGGGSHTETTDNTTGATTITQGSSRFAPPPARASGGGNTSGAGGDMGGVLDYGTNDPARRNLALDLLAQQFARGQAQFERDQRGDLTDILDRRAALNVAEGTPDYYNTLDSAARRKSDTSMDIADVEASRGARRYFMPEVQRQRDDQQNDALRRATEATRIAAGSRNYVANVGANAKLGAAAIGQDRPEEVLAKYFDDLAKSYGTDPRTGASLMPPNMAALRDMLIKNSTQMLGAPTPNQGAAPAAPVQPNMQPGAQNQDPDAAFRAMARDAGWPEQEIELYLQSRR